MSSTPVVPVLSVVAASSVKLVVAGNTNVVEASSVIESARSSKSIQSVQSKSETLVSERELSPNVITGSLDPEREVVHAIVAFAPVPQVRSLSSDDAKSMVKVLVPVMSVVIPVPPVKRAVSPLDIASAGVTSSPSRFQPV